MIVSRPIGTGLPNLSISARLRIYAWNAHREDKTITSVKYDTKKGFYAVAA